jgi:hypothetical protein
MAGFDSTVLTLMLNPAADCPPDPGTGLPVSKARERVELLIQTLTKSKTKIVIPTPVLSEVLVEAGSAGFAYVQILNKQFVFDVRPFDEIAAIQLAEMTKRAIALGDKREGSKEPYQKIKLDRQIVSICKVAGVSTLYASDNSLANFARKAGLSVIGVHELPLPAEPPQLALELPMPSRSSEHDEPEAERDTEDEDEGFNGHAPD